jgi:lipopolysaccharide export system protein LptA
MKSKPSVIRNLFNPATFRVLLWACPWFLAPLVLGYEIQEHKAITAKKPVNINAQQLNFDRLKSLTVFKGLVKAIHDKVTLNSDELRAISDNRYATALGHVLVVDSSTAMTLTCGNMEYQDLMELMTAHDHPLLTAQDENSLPITVLGRQMVFDSVAKTVQINQDVSISQTDGKATAQKATYISAEDKFVLEDDPKVEMKNGSMSGRRIVSNFGAERSIICEGMAEATFYPTGKSASSSPVSGGAPGNPRGNAPNALASGTVPGNPAGNGSPSTSASGTTQGEQPGPTPTIPAHYTGPGIWVPPAR